MVDKQKEKKLSENLNQRRSVDLDLQSFLANLPGMAYRLRCSRQKEYCFDYISDKCLLFFGHTAAAVMQNASLVFESIPESELVELHKVLDQSATRLTPFQHEHRVVSTDSRSLWLQQSAMPQKTMSGELVWNGIALDITDLKVAEESLRLSEKTLLKAQRVCKITSWRIRLGERTDPQSEPEFLYFGLKDGASQISYSELSSFIHPDDRRLFHDAMEKAQNEHTGFDLELRTMDNTGQPSWGHLVADIVRDGNGNFFELIGTMRDITANKTAERERLRDNEIAEQRYRSVVEDQTEIICRFTTDETVLFVNEAWCRFFQKDRQAFVGKSWKSIAYEKDIPKILQQLSILSVENPVMVNENRVYKGDGSLCWVQFVNRGIFNAENTLIEIQSVGRDISDFKQIQNSLQQRDTELRQKNAKLARLNIALEVVVDQKNAQLDHLRSDIIHHYNQFVRPYMLELQESCHDQHNIQYLKLIEQGMQQMLSPFSKMMLTAEHNFTPMEHRIVSFIAAGMTINMLAKELQISPHTVKYHRKNIRTKLGIQNKKVNLRSYLLQLSQLGKE